MYAQYHEYVNMSNISNMLNMQSMHQKAVLEHKIVYLALCPVFLVLGVPRDSSSSSSEISALAVLGVVLGPAAAAGEGVAWAVGAVNDGRAWDVSWRAASAWPVLRRRVDLREIRTLL